MMLDNDHVKHIVGDEAEYLVFPELEKYPELGAAFAIKGAKGYHYEPISDDANYVGIAKEVGIKRDSIIIPFQEHTATVAEYDDAVRDFKETDGLVTIKRNVTLCTKVADCISLLIYDPVNHAIGNVHSGWRGTLQKIALNGVRKMVEEFNSKPSDLICVICPSIRQDHFEVDQDVYEEFQQAFPQIIDEITVQRGDKYYIDTVRCNTWMLEKAGVKSGNIIDSNLCTACHSDVINSYRGNKEAEKSWRNLAMIWLKDSSSVIQ